MKIRHVYVEDDEFGEADMFFTDEGKPLTFWSCNDALYRSEYMNPLFKALGIEVVSEDYFKKGKWRTLARKELKEWLG